MKKRNEKTSARVAKIAGKVLEMDAVCRHVEGLTDGAVVRVKWSEIRALAASALTQTANRPKKLRPYTVDAADIPELGPGFDPPKRKAKRKARGRK